MKKSSGFTVLELMVTVGILALLLGVMFIGINPKSQLDAGHNTQRIAHLKNIVGAINHYTIDSFGVYPVGVTSTLRMIGTSPDGCAVLCGGVTTTEACIDLTADLMPTYLESIPFDPETGSMEKTQYAVETIPAALRVVSCTPDLGQTLEIIQ